MPKTKQIVYLRKSNKPNKKYMATIGKKTVHFGQYGASDYTIHKDPERKKRYEKRHKPRENWNKSGLKTAGFWSKWLLWNKPGINPSIKHMSKKFNITIKRSAPPKTKK